MADPLARPTLSFGNIAPRDPLAASAVDFSMGDGTTETVQFDEVRESEAGPVGVVWSDEDRAARAAGQGAAAAQAAIEAAPEYDADGIRVAPTAQLPDAAAGVDALAPASAPAPELPAFNISTGDAAADWALQQAGFTGFDAVLGAFDEKGDFASKPVLEAAATLAAQASLAERGVVPSSKNYSTQLTAERDRIESSALLTLTRHRGEAQAVATAQAEHARAAKAAAADAEAAKPNALGAIWNSFAGAFIESGGADTLELVNMGASAALNMYESGGDPLSGNLNQIGMLTDASEAIREQAGSMREYAALNDGYAEGDAAFRAVWADPEAGFGSKLVDTAGAALSNPTWLSAQVAASVGYLGGVLLGSKGLGAGAKVAVKPAAAGVNAAVKKVTATRVAAQAAEAAAKPAAVRAAATEVAETTATAAAAKAALKSTSTLGGRTKLAAAFGAYAGAASSADTREVQENMDPAALRASPGWRDTASDLSLALDRAPTDDEIYNAMLGRSQALAAATSGAVTFATTFMSPAVEGTVAGLFTKGASGGLARGATQGVGARVRRGVALGGLEGATEAVQEFVQTAAPTEALRSTVTGRSYGEILEGALANRDYQAAAGMGAVLGFAMGGATGATNFGRGEAVDTKALKTELDAANAAVKTAEAKYKAAEAAAKTAASPEAAADLQAAAADLQNANSAAAAAADKVDVLAQPLPTSRSLVPVATQPSTALVSAPRLLPAPDPNAPIITPAPSRTGTAVQPAGAVANSSLAPDPLAGRTDPFEDMMAQARANVDAAAKQPPEVAAATAQQEEGANINMRLRALQIGAPRPLLEADDAVMGTSMLPLYGQWQAQAPAGSMTLYASDSLNLAVAAGPDGIYTGRVVDGKVEWATTRDPKYARIAMASAHIASDNGADPTMAELAVAIGQTIGTAPTISTPTLPGEAPKRTTVNRARESAARSVLERVVSQVSGGTPATELRADITKAVALRRTDGQVAAFGPKGGANNDAARDVVQLESKVQVLAHAVANIARREFDLSTQSKIEGEFAKVSAGALAKRARESNADVDLRRGKTRELASRIASALNGEPGAAVTWGELKDITLDPTRSDSEQDLAKFAMVELANLRRMYVVRGELEAEVLGEEIAPAPLSGFESSISLEHKLLSAVARAAKAAAVDGRMSVNPTAPAVRVARQRKNPDAPLPQGAEAEIAAVASRHAKAVADIDVGSGVTPEVATIAAAGGASEVSVTSAAALGAGIEATAADLRRRGETAEADSDIRARMGAAEPLATHITEVETTPVLDAVRVQLASSGYFARVRVAQYPDFESANGAEGGRLVPGAAAMVIGEGSEARVVIIRDRIETPAVLRRVLSHEIVGHIGVRHLLGKSGLRDVASSLRKLSASSKITANAVKTVDAELRRRFTAVQLAKFEAKSIDDLPTETRDIIKRNVADSIKKAEYDGLFAEEVLAYASESFTNAKAPSQRSAFSRVLQWFSDLLYGASGVRLTSEADIARLVYDASLVTRGRVPVQSYKRPTDKRAISGGLLSRMRAIAFDSQADFYKVLQVGDVVAGALDADGSGGGAAQREAVQSTLRAARNAVNVQAELARQVDGIVVPAQFALLDAIREVQATNDLAKTIKASSFQDRANQHIYLSGAKERIDYLLTSDWIEQNADNPAARSFIASYDAAIAEIEALLATVPQGQSFNPLTEVPIIQRGREIYANWAASTVMPEELQDILNDPKRGKTQVGYSKFEIDAELATDAAYGVDKAVERAGITGENGVLSRAADVLLAIRRRGDYGNSGTARAIMANMTNYVPMMDIDPDTGARTRPASSTAAAYAGMSRVAPDLEGRGDLPSASPFEQLGRMARSVAADVPTRRINQGLLRVITDRTGAVRPEFARMFELLADPNTGAYEELTHAQASLKLSSMSRADQERTQVIYFDNGNATLLTVKDDAVRDAMFARFKPRWEDSPNLNPAVRGAAKASRAATRAMSLMLTGANPMFWPKQLARDMQQVILQSGFEQRVGAGRAAKTQLSALSYLPKFVQFSVLSDEAQTAAITKALADPKDPLHTFALRSAYGGAARYASQLGDPLSISSLAGSPVGVRATQGARFAGRYLLSGANAVENAGRQAMFDAVYEAEVERRVADAKRDNITLDMDAVRDASAAAATEAAVEMINFGQRSALGEAMGTILPFAQTALSGAEQVFTRRIWKNGKAPVEMIETAPGQWRQRLKDGWHKEINVAQIATMTAVSVASATAVIAYATAKAEDEGLDGDEWYKVVRPFELTKSIALPFGDDAPMTWQTQPGWFQFVHGMVALGVAHANGYPAEDLYGEMAGHALYNLTPVNSRLGTELGVDSLLEQITPVVIMPLVQMYGNKDAFGSRLRQLDMDSGEVEGLSTYRGSPTTPDIYTSMAEFTDSVFGNDPSPDTFRHLARSYGGGFGQMLDVAGRYMQSQVNGLDTSLTETVAAATGLVAREATSTSQRLFFDQRERLVTPISRAYERALSADRAAGLVDVDYRSAPAGSYVRELDETLGRGSLKAILGPDKERVSAIGELKTEYMQYQGTGDVENISRIRENMEAIYSSTYTSTREVLASYGIESGDDLSWLDEFYPRR